VSTGDCLRLALQSWESAMSIRFRGSSFSPRHEFGAAAHAGLGIDRFDLRAHRFVGGVSRTRDVSYRLAGEHAASAGRLAAPHFPAQSAPGEIVAVITQLGDDRTFFSASNPKLRRIVRGPAAAMGVEMRNFRFGLIATVVFALAASALPAAAATFKVLYSFKHPCCGQPFGRLHFMNGRLFGTGFGESGHDGEVFELTNSGSAWKENSPLFFSGSNGSNPSAGLIQDSNGILYGTTEYGDAYGGGNVFYLYHSGSTWFHGTLWAFGGYSGDGINPLSDLVTDSSGNIYSTTYEGGAYGKGSVFELSHSGGTETVLYSFMGGSDGSNPYAGLLMDNLGNLYGTTRYGGNGIGTGTGTVFELSQSGGPWNETVLYRFSHKGSDGSYPDGVLVKDTKGALYGATSNGGHGSGNVFRVYQSGGVWKESVIYTFSGGSDGAVPYGGLRWDGTSTLYGTASGGGMSGNGVVFELTEPGGVWSESVLYTFTGGSDGAHPYDQVILDKSGNLYGTTSGGGKYGYGSVWEVVP
jgi:uncharacterized repeat protein (TIGR03803 family)